MLFSSWVGTSAGASAGKPSYGPAIAAWILSAVFAIMLPLAALAWDTVEYADVNLGQQTLFRVTNSRFMSAEERAQTISQRLTHAVTDGSANPEELRVRSGINNVAVIAIGDESICTATDQDAAAFGMTKTALTEQWMAKIKSALMAAKVNPSLAQTAPSTSPKKGQPPEQETKKRSSKLNDHAVLLLFLEIAVLLLSSLICGELFVLMGQPAIIGQILAGVLLGQTVFGSLFPDLSLFLFPENDLQSKLIEVVSWIGVSFLLMLTGMETDASVFKRLGKPAMALTLGGLLGPLIVGAALSFLVPVEFIKDASMRPAFALFMGTVFAVSSVPVVGKLLSDMRLMRRDVGQLVLATSLGHDLLCCLLLALIAVMAGGESGDSASGGNALTIAIIGTIGFVTIMYFGRPVFFYILRWVNDKVSTRDGMITAMVVLLLLSAAATQALGIHIVLGAFAAGVILSQAPVINHKLVKPLETVTMGFFAPIFFASACLNVNLTTLLEPKLAVLSILLCVAAIASKLAACYVAGKATGLGTWESISIGVGANAKGSMGIILAMLGSTLNLISTDMFAIVIFVSLFSTAIVPPAIKWSLNKVKLSEEERARISKQERQERTILNSIRRILWPTSDEGSRNLFLAKLIDSVAKNQVIETTALWVKTNKTNAHKPFSSIVKAVDRKHVSVLARTVRSQNIVEAITDEANLGYDLIVMMEDKPSADANYVFGELTDNVILGTNTRALIACTPEKYVDNKRIERVVIPVSGTELALNAGEFGISLAQALGAKVTCICVQDGATKELYSTKTLSGVLIENEISSEIESSLTELAQALDVPFKIRLIPTDSQVAQSIILAADQNKADLIVVGAEPKLGKGLFMGHTINYILRHATCPVIVLKQ